MIVGVIALAGAGGITFDSGGGVVGVGGGGRRSTAGPPPDIEVSGSENEAPNGTIRESVGKFLVK